jgi:hypothetical protein
VPLRQYGPFWLDVLLFATVLLVAAYFRFDRLDLAQFKNDEARAISLATGIARGQAFPLVGIPSSAGPQNGPALPYLIAVPLLVRSDALFATGFVAALNVAAIGVVFWISRHHFGALAATVAAALFGVGFWPVTFSRFIWAQNTLPLFSALFGAMLLSAVAGRRPWLFVLAAALAGLMAQLHFSALAFVPALVVLGALFYRRLGTTALFALPAFFVALSPYLLGEAFREADNLRGISAVLAGNFSWHPEALTEPLRLMGSEGYDAWLGQRHVRLAQVAETARWPNGIASGLAVIGLGYALWRGLFSKRQFYISAAYVVLAVWASIPALAFVYTPFPVYEHYFVALLPAVFVLAGVGVAGIVDIARQVGGPRRVWPMRVASVALITVLVGVVAMQLAVNALAPEAQEGENRLIGRGVSLGDLRAAVQLLADVQEADRWVIARDDVREPLQAIAELSSSARTLSGQVLVAGTSPNQAYLMVEGSGPAAVFLEQDLAPFLVARRETPSPAAVFRLYSVPGGRVDQIARQGEVVMRSTSVGVEVVSIDVPRSASLPGGRLPVRIAWRAADNALASNSRYSFFAHLVQDASGAPLAQEDGLGYPRVLWRSSDLVVTWLEVVLPPTLASGDYWLRTGLYDLDTGAAAPFVEQGPLRQSDYLLFGPVRVQAS